MTDDAIEWDSNVAEVLLVDKPEGRIALCALDRDFTYGDLRRAALEFATSLDWYGCKKGERVLVISGNSFHWVAAYLGLLGAGMVCVPLPGSIAERELEWIIRTTESRIAFVERGMAETHAPTLKKCGVKIIEEASMRSGRYFTGAVEEGTQSPHCFSARMPADLAALMFTSGSTGTPRGVMVSHGNILANTNSIVEVLGLQETDRIMVVLPFHYCFGASLLHTHLKVGATLVLDSRFAYPEVVLQRMQETECTSFAGVPSHYQILLRKSSLAKRSLPYLRTLLQAGGHLAPSFLRELQEIVPKARVYVMYGQTEATARLSCLPPSMLAERPGSVGKAIPGVTLRVLKKSGEGVLPGEVGELVAEGENITMGYWRDSLETDRSFRDGRLYTGDLATVDAEGFIYVVDRAKDFVKRGGVRVSCRLIEDRLLECNELLEVAVVGVSDDMLGEAICAFVVPRYSDQEGVEGRLRAYSKTSLPASLHPRDIIVMRSLPKNSAGKVLRAQLKKMSSESVQKLDVGSDGSFSVLSAHS